MARDPALPGPPAVLGVDGYRGGWIGARVVDTQVEWLTLPDATALLAASTATAATAVDAPIGLPDAGPRSCDLAARKALGRRGSSVFPAPVRAVLAADSYAQACELSRAAQGVALSLQAWNITDKIRDLDAALRARPDALTECHPELSFLRMTGSALPAKRTPAGVAARLLALSDWLPDLVGSLERLPSGPRLDDALDALACAWTARRIAEGRAERLPEGELERDRLGLPMQIVC